MSTVNYDLTPFMAPYLDPHLLHDLISTVGEHNLYEPEVIKKASILVLKRTKLLDDLEAAYNNYDGNDATIIAEKNRLSEIVTLKREMLHRISNPPDSVKLVDDYFKTRQEQDRVSADQAYSAGITAKVIESYCDHAKCLYEVGRYEETAAMLKQILRISQPASSVTVSTNFGYLASLIYTLKWDEALRVSHSIKDSIENRSINQLDQLRLRAWLLHWSLFIFINIPNGWELLVELFMDKVYLQTIENCCPWMIRYLVIGIILCPSKRKIYLKEVLREVSFLSYLYVDPVTQLIGSLFTEFDCETALIRLQECKSLFEKDYFVSSCANNIANQASTMIRQVFCQIHTVVSVPLFAQTMKITESEALNWLNDYVRGVFDGVNIDAKYDSVKNQFIFSPHAKNTQQITADRLKELSNRTEAIRNTLQRIAVREENNQA